VLGSPKTITRSVNHFLKVLVSFNAPQEISFVTNKAFCLVEVSGYGFTLLVLRGHSAIRTIGQWTDTRRRWERSLNIADEMNRAGIPLLAIKLPFSCRGRPTADALP
jgi:hypothetical protein